MILVELSGGTGNSNLHSIAVSEKNGNFNPIAGPSNSKDYFNPHVSANFEETGGKFMSELKHEYGKRKEYRRKHQENGYHAVVKGRTDNLDSDELDLYRFMIGGVQGK
jgi:hypothetical protein